MVNGVSYLKRNFSWTEVIIKEPDFLSHYKFCVEWQSAVGEPRRGQGPDKYGSGSGKNPDGQEFLRIRALLKSQFLN